MAVRKLFVRPGDLVLIHVVTDLEFGLTKSEWEMHKPQPFSFSLSPEPYGVTLHDPTYTVTAAFGLLSRLRSQMVVQTGMSDGLGLPVAAYDAGGEVRIEAAKQMDGCTLWTVRGHGNVLAKTGEWEWEPMPSGRDDDFLARCRFDTPQEALACLRGAKW